MEPHELVSLAPWICRRCLFIHRTRHFLQQEDFVRRRARKTNRRQTNMKTNVEINEKYFERESHRSYQPVGEPPATPLAFLRCYCSVALASYGTSPLAQTPPVPATTDKPGSMKHFALIF